MAYLWPERDGAKAAHLLTQCVYTVRRALGQCVLVSGGDALGLDDRRLSVGVLLFRRARAGDELELATSCYSGPFMDGFVLSAARAFEEWIAGERERLRLAYRRCWRLWPHGPRLHRMLPRPWDGGVWY